MKHLSLFSGIGGIDLAAEWAGFESVAMVERDKYCQKVLAKNFPNAKIYDDVTKFNGYEYRNKIDLISGGFPCQPFSCIGGRKGASDERALFPEILRILRETNARWFLGENVPGLLTIDGGQYFGQILNDLAEIGYGAGWIMYGAKDVGAVHRRNRVFIVAYSKNLFCNGSSYQSSVSPLSEIRDGDCSRVIGYSESKSGLQANTSAIPKRGGRDSRQDSCCRHWQPIAADSNGSGCEKQRERVSTETEHKTSERCCYQHILGGDWKQWGISPTIGIESRVRRGNDGVPNRVDRLKSLGNAVVPQQVYPILVEIARQMK